MYASFVLYKHFVSWFCHHGFGYGTSIIPGAEGRRDAMVALYTHAEYAPSVIVYDFACSLEEFSRNRELSFFSRSTYVLGVLGRVL